MSRVSTLVPILSVITLLMIPTLVPAQTARSHWCAEFRDADLFAQHDPDDPEPGFGHGFKPGGPPDDQRMRKHVEQFRMLKLLELLDLSEDQEVRFITLFHRVRQEEQELRMNKMAVADSLAETLDSGNISRTDVDGSIRKILQESRKELQVREDFLKEASDILSPEQLGKLVLFQERFDLELLGAVQAFRERRGRMGQQRMMDNADSAAVDDN